MTQQSSKLSLFSASTIIMGSMVGSGIFLVSSDMTKALGSPWLVLLNWGVAGLVTILGALCYGELASKMPDAGGQYIYLERSFGKLTSFLYGWSLFGVIQTGTIAAVAMAFALYATELIPTLKAVPFWQMGSFSIGYQQLLAIGVIWLLSLSNTTGVKNGAVIQNVFTVIKVLALMAIVIAGIYFSVQGNVTIHSLKELSDQNPLENQEFGLTILIFFSVMTGSLFSMDAWNNITFIAGEIKDASKNIPKALLFGTLTVITLYILVNVIYFYFLSPQQIVDAPEGRVAALLMRQLAGNVGNTLLSVLVLLSTFGCINGMALSGSRVYYAMAKEKSFIPIAAKLNSKQVPANSLYIQATWASLLVLSGSYGQLLDYIMFVVMIFYILTTIGLMKLRRQETERPVNQYRVALYPILPILYIGLAGLFTLSLLIYKPELSLRGLVIVVIGIPIYFLFIQEKKVDKIS